VCDCVDWKFRSEKHHTLSSRTDVSPSIFTQLDVMIEDVRAIISPHNFLGPFCGLVARGHRKFD